MQRRLLLSVVLTLASCTGTMVDESETDEVEAALTAGSYRFQTAVGSNKCIDVSGGKSADGTNIQQWSCHTGDPQIFRVEARAGGLSRLVNPATNKCLDIAAAGTADGTNIQLWTCNDTAAQNFELLDAGDGRILMRNPNSGKCVDVAGAGTGDGTNIQLWRCNGTNAQVFKPISVNTPPPPPPPPPPPSTDVTFFVISDTHADPALSPDHVAMARAVNKVAQDGSWPSSINGSATGFQSGRIGAPKAVVFTGDIMGWGNSSAEIPSFRHYFEQGASGDAINYPGYVGLGNHDLDDTPDRTGAAANQARSQAWAYVDARHRGAGAPVKVASFDDASHAYSWDIGGVHFVQMHRYPGDTHWGLASNLTFLANDLRARAGDGRPVFIFHHYGMDAFGTQDRWWTAPERNAYRDTIRNYNVSAIFAGHSHAAMQYTWEGERLFQVNNAKAEIDSGNRDGNGSFAVVRITNQKLYVVTCRWRDQSGNYEFVAPFYAGPAKQ